MCLKIERIRIHQSLKDSNEVQMVVSIQVGGYKIPQNLKQHEGSALKMCENPVILKYY